MSKYKVTITETLEKEFEVEADTAEEAQEKVEAGYYNAEYQYILDADSYVGADFKTEKVQEKENEQPEEQLCR